MKLKILMPPYLFHTETWKSLWPLPLTALILSFIIFLFVKPSTDKKTFFIGLLAFSLLGLVTGYITGFSREPAVGAVLPAVLSLIGGLTIYLLSKESLIRALVSSVLLSFTLNLLVGIGWGAVMRSVDEEYKHSKAYLMKKALTEAEVRDFRKDLGLGNN